MNVRAIGNKAVTPEFILNEVSALKFDQVIVLGSKNDGEFGIYVSHMTMGQMLFLKEVIETQTRKHMEALMK